MARPTQRSADDAHDLALRALVRTTVPAIVESYDDARNVATVRLRRNPVDERGRPFEAPPLRDLPVAWPSGGGWLLGRGSLLTNDLVLLLVSDRELGPQILGPTGVPVSGESRRMHDLSDAIVLPLGLTIPTSPIPPGPPPLGAGSAIVGRGDGTVGLYMTPADAEVEAPTIRVGRAAALGAARTTDATAADTSMTAWIAAVQAVCTGAAALLGLTPPVAPTDFGTIVGGSAKVTIE